jgi:hypothetical protein
MGKSLTTKVTKHTKGKKASNLQAFFLRDLRVLCGENDFPVKNGGTDF